MRHVLMIVLAVVCGIAAFAFNAAYLSSQTRPQYYVAVKNPVAAGERCDKDSFRKIPIQGNIKTAAVPYDDVATLWGRVAVRDLAPGELVLWQDIAVERASMALRSDETGLYIPVEQLHLEPGLLRVGAEIGFVVPRASGVASASTAAQTFEQLGPFRIVSINSKVEESPYGDDAEHELTRVANITVAARLPSGGAFDNNANRLIDASSRAQIHAVTFNGRIVSAVAASQP